MHQPCSGERVTGSAARYSNTDPPLVFIFTDGSDTADQPDVRRLKRNQEGKQNSQTQTISLRAGKRVKGETIQVSIKFLSS